MSGPSPLSHEPTAWTFGIYRPASGVFEELSRVSVTPPGATYTSYGVTYVDSPPAPPSPPSPPPLPPLQPGSRYAISSSELRAALSDSAVRRIVLVAGTYEFDDDMPCKGGSAALCIDRDVTIEAEVAGSVVLNATGVGRVIYISTAGRAQLVGLNITGGAAYNVSSRASIEPMRDVASPPGSSHFHCVQGAGIRIAGSAELTDCSIHDNEANGVSFLIK